MASKSLLWEEIRLEHQSEIGEASRPMTAPSAGRQPKVGVMRRDVNRESVCEGMVVEWGQKARHLAGHMGKPVGGRELDSVSKALQTPGGTHKVNITTIATAVTLGIPVIL